MTTAREKTMTPAQMAWALRRGFAWPDPDNYDPEDDDLTPILSGLSDTFWTREGGYQWDVDRQLYAMVF